MAQLTESLVRSILNGGGFTRGEIEQLCHAWLNTRPAPTEAEAHPEADASSRIVSDQLLHWGGIPVRVTGTVTTSPGNWPLIDELVHRNNPNGLTGR